MAHTTPNNPAAWSPDTTAYVASDVVPDALLHLITTSVGHVEGDRPAIRVPYVADDGAAVLVAEGAEIDSEAQEFAEVVVQTNKISALGAYSYETLQQPQAARMIVESLSRSLVAQANEILLNADEVGGPTGVLEHTTLTDGGTLGDDLDPIVDAIASIESAGGQANYILCSPATWATLSKLKAGTGSNTPLVAPDVSAAAGRSLLGLPVITTPAMTSGLLVGDRGAILSASGQVRMDQSEHVFFSSDAVAVRTSWRFGFAVMRADRLVSIATE